MTITYYDNYKKTNRQQNLRGQEDEIFEQLYKLNNSLRYCNGSYWKCESEDNENKYLDWRKNLSKSRHFNLYYGNGVVD